MLNAYFWRASGRPLTEAREFKALEGRVFAAILCLSLVGWSAQSPVNHVPTIHEAIQDHFEVIEDHGHSHGFAEDLFWALHGHSHDAADHDHYQAFLTLAAGFGVDTIRDNLRLMGSAVVSYQRFRIDRPPRV